MSNKQINPDFIVSADVDDPFAVFYVVNDSRDEEGNIAPEADIVQASSEALIQMLSSTDEEVVARVQDWTNGRIRKIVKRARASAWNKAASLEFPHFASKHKSAEVIVFAPMRISEQPKPLKKLQVTGLNSTDTSSVDYDTEQSHLLVQVNEKLNMSTGKMVAQVGHAIQLFFLYAEDSEKQHWLSHGVPVKVVMSKNLSDETATGIVVHDAGFTEVPSGSLTATAEYRF